MAKTKTATTAPAPTTAPTTAPPASAKKAKKPSASKKKEEVVKDVKVEPTPVPEVVVEEEAKVDNTTNEIVTESAPMEDAVDMLFKQLASLNARIQAHVTEGNALKTEVKQLEKQCSKTVKGLQKICNKKRRRKSSNTGSEQTGFKKPVCLSKELAAFINVPFGTLESRANVHKIIHEYILTNNLKDPKNGRNIHPDQKLNNLLKVGDTQLSYFNLQTYMSPHFAKKGETFA